MKELTAAEVKSRLKEIIVNDLDANINISDIKDDTPLYDEGLGLDSIAIINLIVLIENRFDMSFDENEISSALFSNIDSLAGFVRSKVAPKPTMNNA